MVPSVSHTFWEKSLSCYLISQKVPSKQVIALVEGYTHDDRADIDPSYSLTWPCIRHQRHIAALSNVSRDQIALQKDAIRISDFSARES
jgi:hypothetical protein